MDVDIAAVLGLLGPFSIAITLVVLGLISRRLGEQGNAKSYYLGFFCGAALMLTSVAAQFLDLLLHFQHTDSDALWVILENGLPALAITLGVIFAWRYWSWLLAERD
jgi:hypothetical protein